MVLSVVILARLPALLGIVLFLIAVAVVMGTAALIGLGIGFAASKIFPKLDRNNAPSGGAGGACFGLMVGGIAHFFLGWTLFPVSFVDPFFDIPLDLVIYTVGGAGAGALLVGSARR